MSDQQMPEPQMPDPRMHPALERVLRDPANAAAFETLTTSLAGADLTTFLLGAFAARAERLSATEVLRQYENDRFVAPAQIDALPLARLEAQALDVASHGFEPVALAPIAPLGTHLALGGVPQNNVVSTARVSEVTADPTNSLALEASLRRSALLRSDHRSTEQVALAATHRVVRAQHFAGPRSFAHFALLGLVTAGRDQGDFAFEIGALERQIRTVIAVVRLVTAAPIQIQLTPFRDTLTLACGDMADRLVSDGVSCDVWPEREHGRNYYRSIGFKLNIRMRGEVFELGDGGDVWWTQDLLQNKKERLVIGGLGLERLVMLQAEEPS